jgi:hypothetical protein
MWCLYITKIINSKKIMLVTTIFRRLMCFHLNYVNINFAILLLSRENSLTNNIRYIWSWLLKVLVWVIAHYAHPKREYESPFL